MEQPFENYEPVAIENEDTGRMHLWARKDLSPTTWMFDLVTGKAARLYAIGQLVVEAQTAAQDNRDYWLRSLDMVAIVLRQGRP